MRKLIIAFSLSWAAFAQQPQVDVVKTDVLPYDKTTTRVVVSVRNVAAAELHNVWVKISGTATTSRRKAPYLKVNDASCGDNARR